MRFSFILLVIGYLTVSLSANTVLKADDAALLSTKIRGESGEIGKVLQIMSVKYGIKFGYATTSLEPTRVSFGKGTLRQVLNSIVKKMKGHTWKVEPGIVLLYPKDVEKSKHAGVLEGKVDSLIFKKGNNIDTLRFLLYKDKQFSQALNQLDLSLQLVYRLVSVSHFDSDGIGTDTDLFFNDTRLMDILNRLIKSSTSHVWEVKINYGKVYIDIY